MSTIPFEHTMAAHCETGTLAAMLHHKGLDLSEPMIFGISGGIFFGYLKPPALTFPTIITRTRPGVVRNKIAKRLGIGFDVRTYKDPLKAQADLDQALGRNQPVAVQTDVFYMDYAPRHTRVHFNAHYIIVIGKEGDRYMVSDCYQPNIESIPAELLAKGRFARGDLAPKGLAYYAVSVPPNLDLRPAIAAGIRESAFNMVGIPVPFLGVKGIRLFARKVTDWPKLTRDMDHLSHEIMMINVVLEERGTGGAGFRFMFATFLQQAAQVLRNDDLQGMAKQMMEIGDRWRELSLFAARIGKARDLGSGRLRELQTMILDRADAEEKFFRRLREIGKRLRVR